jgi:RHS repeat-associated protein
VTAKGMTVGGANVTYDGTQKKTAQLLSLSGGERSNVWSYDKRSRLSASVLARDADATPATEDVTSADFRSGLNRTALTPVDPPSVKFLETSAGHMIDRIERGLAVEQFSYTAGERTGDGRYVYAYDDKGRLATVSEKLTPGTTVRRVVYAYAGNDRLVGRRAEYADVSLGGFVASWKLEDRPEILASDQLPADVTFVWDTPSDRLVAMFKAGASEHPTIDEQGGLIRQILHGDGGLDDPMEIAASDPAAQGGVAHLYPIYDEAGAGALQIILNEKGEIISRTAAAGPYGEDEVVLAGPAVDRVDVLAQRDDKGKLTGVTVRMRSTESLNGQTVGGGTRLAIVDASGRVARLASAAASLAGDATVTWTMTPEEWSAFTDETPVTVNGTSVTPKAISIAATNSLRAAAWSNTTPVLAAPSWATSSKPVFSSTSMPVEVRESIASIRQTVDNSSIPAAELYRVPTLTSLGTPRFGGIGPVSDPTRMIVASTFQAQPFQEPMTGKNYVRSHWLDPQTGTWLTPDPRGYRDSSNLYAFAGGDPVNHRDPSGRYEEDVHHWLTVFLAQAAGFDATAANLLGSETEKLDTDERDAMFNGRNPPAMKKYHMVTPARLAEMKNEAFGILRAPGEDQDDEENPCTGDVREAMDETLHSRDSLRPVGEYLHALEDSYAHQRNQNRRDFTQTYGTEWGHASLRKGHAPDQTFQRPEVAMQMARDLFETLKTLCNETQSKPCANAQSWESIEGQVREFVKMRPATETGWVVSSLYPTENVTENDEKEAILNKDFPKSTDPVAIVERRNRRKSNDSIFTQWYKEAKEFFTGKDEYADK